MLKIPPLWDAKAQERVESACSCQIKVFKDVQADEAFRSHLCRNDPRHAPLTIQAVPGGTVLLCPDCEYIQVWTQREVVA